MASICLEAVFSSFPYMHTQAAPEVTVVPICLHHAFVPCLVSMPVFLVTDLQSGASQDPYEEDVENNETEQARYLLGGMFSELQVPER